MSKIAIVGAGNAGCITALELFYLNIEEQEDVITEIEIFHDPDIPIERVCLLYTSPSPRDMRRARMPSSA